MADFLLLHGMNVGAWEWERVIPALQSDPRTGKVIAPNMPGRGPGGPPDLSTIRLRDYTATAIAALREHDLRDVIVVGHSGGGIYLQATVAAEPERVRRLVFLCAAIPERGRNILHRQPLPVGLFYRLLLWVRRADRRGIVPSRRLARFALCHTLRPEDCEPVLDRLVPEPQALLVDRIDWPADRVRVPATYILTNRDRVIRPHDQGRMAVSLPRVEVIRLDAGHADPVVYPEWLVALLLSYA